MACVEEPAGVCSEEHIRQLRSCASSCNYKWATPGCAFQVVCGTQILTKSIKQLSLGVK